MRILSNLFSRYFLRIFNSLGLFLLLISFCWPYKPGYIKKNVISRLFEHLHDMRHQQHWRILNFFYIQIKFHSILLINNSLYILYNCLNCWYIIWNRYIIPTKLKKITLIKKCQDFFKDVTNVGVQKVLYGNKIFKKKM